ncbi:MAG: glycosyltransferase family 2 protein [Paludibacteraceae bacterium]
MLSILIPVYNYDVTRLVKELHSRATDTFVDFEIRVVEDGSTLFLAENKRIASLPFCEYEILTDNVGRSAIRNLLADKAKYNHLLFLDCDAEVSTTHFIEKYLPFCHDECVVIGGTAYEPGNNDPAYSLRLKYGRKREAKTATEREKDGKYSHFSTFNFLIAKSVFQKIRFDETISGYGHEDTLFGHRIAELRCEIHQIDNPLIHKGLDDNQTFIRKTEEGTRNLYLLYQTGRYPFLAKQSKLLQTFIQIKNKNLIRLFSALYPLLKLSLYKNLTGKNPSLQLFDLYKLLFLAKTANKK